MIVILGPYLDFVKAPFLDSGRLRPVKVTAFLAKYGFLWLSWQENYMKGGFFYENL
jgi:hypothetical protein